MDRPRVVIVDDEPLAREKLRNFLEKDQRVEIAGEAGNGLGAVELIEAERPDLVFLDIQMPELDAFGVLEALELDPLPRVVFVTAFDEHAVKAFQVRALDYLLKPVDRERFTQALDRALEDLERDDPARGTQQVLEAARDASTHQRRLERFLVRKRGRMFLVPVDEVDWIETAGNYVEIHVGKESHLVRGTLGELEERLDPGRFIRVSRAAIVKLERIRELQPWSHGDLLIILEAGTELKLSRRYRDRLEGIFGS